MLGNKALMSSPNFCRILHFAKYCQYKITLYPVPTRQLPLEVVCVTPLPRCLERTVKALTRVVSFHSVSCIQA